MAFDITYMAKVSSSGNPLGLNVWTYNGLATGANDTVAEIAASGYFNSFMQNITLGNGPLQIGDTIMVSGSDGNGMYKVATVTTNVTVSAFAAANAVDTANLVNGAVTAAKLASDAVTTVKILDANVTTAKIADDAVTTAKLDPTTLQYASVLVSAAEFNGMYAAPKLLVAAPGANKLIVLAQANVNLLWGAAQFASGGAVHIQYDSTANGAGVKASLTQAAAGFTGATANTMFPFGQTITSFASSTTVNKGLYLSNATGAFTTGDSTFIVDVWYRVVPTV